MDPHCWICHGEQEQLHSLGCACKTRRVHLGCAARWYTPRLVCATSGMATERTWRFESSVGCETCNRPIPTPFPELLFTALTRVVQKSRPECITDQHLADAADLLEGEMCAEPPRTKKFMSVLPTDFLCHKEHAKGVDGAALQFAARLEAAGSDNWRYLLGVLCREHAGRRPNRVLRALVVDDAPLVLLAVLGSALLVACVAATCVCA